MRFLKGPNPAPMPQCRAFRAKKRWYRYDQHIVDFPRNRFVKSRNDSRALKSNLGNNIRIISKTLTKFYESLSIKFAVELICFFRHVDRQQFLFSFMHEIVVKKGIIIPGNFALCSLNLAANPGSNSSNILLAIFNNLSWNKRQRKMLNKGLKQRKTKVIPDSYVAYWLNWHIFQDPSDHRKSPIPRPRLLRPRPHGRNERSGNDHSF